MNLEILSPYQHELNGQGPDCASDCPACRWIAEQKSSIANVAEKEENYGSLIAHRVA